MTKPVAVVVGVGSEQGIGAAVCRKFAAEGCHVLVAGRTPGKIETVAASLVSAGGSADAVPTDATKEDQVAALFDRAAAAEGGPDALAAVVFNAGANRAIPFLDVEAALFEDFWRVGCFAGFLVGREAARRMVPLGRGTVIFTGASGSLRGKATFAQFAAAKAGLRMVSQSMAREFGPQGLHVAHVLIDGAVDGERIRTLAPQIVERLGDDGLLKPDAIAEAYWWIHRQSRSAWTQEVDLRPFKESF